MTHCFLAPWKYSYLLPSDFRNLKMCVLKSCRYINIMIIDDGLVFQ